MCKKFRFRGTFDKQDFKRAQALLISAPLSYSEIIASELASLNCPYEEQDTFHRQTMF